MNFELIMAADASIAGMNVPVWAVALLVISIVVGAIHTIWTKAIKPISSVFKKIHAMYERIVEYDDRLSVVEKRSEELVNNSGTSLRDAVDRIEAAQLLDSKMLEKHIEWGQGELLKVWQNLASRDAVEAAAKTAEILEERGEGDGMVPEGDS